MSKLEFTVTGKGKTSQGYFSRNWAAEEAIDDILTALSPFGMPKEEALRRARRLPADPENLELQNALAGLHWEQGLRDEAAQIWRRAFELGQNLIPKRFVGQIRWSVLDNRPFLRIAYGELIARLHAGEISKADALAQRILNWSPEDNLGVRWLLPDIAFKSGKLDVARNKYLEFANELPEAWYQAGRIAFIQRDYVDACTFVRRGILANPYIAEGLTGRLILQDHGYWHGTNKVASEWAVNFLSGLSGNWADAERDFVDWVFNSSAVLRERATLVDLHEQLSTKLDYAARSGLVDRLLSHGAAFDPDLSSQMVHARTNRYGADYWPWERGGEARHPVHGQ